MNIGTPADRLEDTFYRKVQISERFARIGMSPERLLEVVADYDVIALTSIFTQQTSRCLEVGSLVKESFPEKLLVAGGVNARSLREHFLDHGFDVIFLSEGEKPIVQLAACLHSGKPALCDIEGIAYRRGGQTIVNPVGRLTLDIDEVPHAVVAETAERAPLGDQPNWAGEKVGSPLGSIPAMQRSSRPAAALSAVRTATSRRNVETTLLVISPLFGYTRWSASSRNSNI